MNEGLVINTVLSLCVDFNDNVFAGSDYGRIYKSTDQGANWKEYIVDSDGIPTLAMDSLGLLFAGTIGRGIYRSSDYGENWYTVNNGLGNLYVISLTVDSSGTLFAGAVGGIFQSTNAGENWTQVDTLPNNTVVLCLATGPGGIILAGTNDSGIFRSTDGGSHWTQIGTSLFSINSLRITRSGIAFAGCEGIYGGGVYRSIDNGNTWFKVGLNRISVLSIVDDLEGKLYAGTTYSGVYLSTNSGDNWTQVNSGLTHSIVNALAIDPGGYIFAGTSGGGVYRSTQSIVASAEDAISGILPSSILLHQNHPNPFNPTTTIEYELPFTSRVIIKVYNLLGQIIFTLTNEIQQAGFKSATWNVNNAASGVYFYRLEAVSVNDPSKSFMQVKKMVLVR
jgi:photosystem II stability/assembly factor-like uncharacterized protein